MLFLGCKYLGTIWIMGFTLHRAMISLFLIVDIEVYLGLFILVQFLFFFVRVDPMYLESASR